MKKYLIGSLFIGVFLTWSMLHIIDVAEKRIDAVNDKYENVYKNYRKLRRE